MDWRSNFFLGTCRLSKACRKFGLRALPVDKDSGRAECCTVASYDLTDRQQHETLVEVLTAEKKALVYAHCAPRCVTASRARGRRMHGVPLHCSRGHSVAMNFQTAFRI